MPTLSPKLLLSWRVKFSKYTQPDPTGISHGPSAEASVHAGNTCNGSRALALLFESGSTASKDGHPKRSPRPDLETPTLPFKALVEDLIGRQQSGLAGQLVDPRVLDTDVVKILQNKAATPKYWPCRAIPHAVCFPQRLTVLLITSQSNSQPPLHCPGSPLQTRMSSCSKPDWREGMGRVKDSGAVRTWAA